MLMKSYRKILAVLSLGGILLVQGCAGGVNATAAEQRAAVNQIRCRSYIAPNPARGPRYWQRQVTLPLVMPTLTLSWPALAAVTVLRTIIAPATIPT